MDGSHRTGLTLFPNLRLAHLERENRCQGEDGMIRGTNAQDLYTGSILDFQDPRQAMGI